MKLNIKVKSGIAYKKYKKETRIPFWIAMLCLPLLLLTDGILKYICLGIMIGSVILFLIKNAKNWKCPTCGTDLPTSFHGGSVSTPILIDKCPNCGEDLTK